MSDDNCPEALAEVCHEAHNACMGFVGPRWANLDGPEKHVWRNVAMRSLKWCRANRGPEMLPPPIITPGHRAVYPSLVPFDPVAAGVLLERLTDAFDAMTGEIPGKAEARGRIAQAIGAMSAAIAAFYTTSHTVTKPA